MKKLAFVFSISIFLVVCLASFAVAPVAAAASAATVNDVQSAESQYPFDYTDLISELEASTNLQGIPFSWDLYPYSAYGQLELYTFLEYSYADISMYRDRLALYVYLYNPGGKDLLDVSITMATEYADDLDDTGVRLPTRFEQFDLQICSKTPDNLFYKARVLDDGYFSVYHHTKDFPEGRLYYVSTLTTSGQSVAVGEEFIYTGYAKGMNMDQIDYSTLEVRNRARNVLTVELQDTFYRMGQPDQEGEYATQDTLHSVYFSLPNKTLLQYGYVDKIHGSYEEYKTLPIYILSEKDVYEQMLSKHAVFTSTVVFEFK